MEAFEVLRDLMFAPKDAKRNEGMVQSLDETGSSWRRYAPTQNYRASALPTMDDQQSILSKASSTNFSIPSEYLLKN